MSPKWKTHLFHAFLSKPPRLRRHGVCKSPSGCLAPKRQKMCLCRRYGQTTKTSVAPYPLLSYFYRIQPSKFKSRTIPFGSPVVPLLNKIKPAFPAFINDCVSGSFEDFVKTQISSRFGVMTKSHEAILKRFSISAIGI